MGVRPLKDRQGTPRELGSLTREILFVGVCTTGQMMFAFLLGNINVNQEAFRHALGMTGPQLPWLTGSYLVTLGLSVIVFGAMSDLVSPRMLVIGAFFWLTIWNVVGAFSISPNRSTMFFIVRAMQGSAVGILVSTSMSLLGRVYKPGRRKTQAFSAMAAMAPLGFEFGNIQGGALSAHLPWIFGTNAMVSAICGGIAAIAVPVLQPAVDAHDSAPSIRDYDYKGAACATLGSTLLVVGLTQGPAAAWSPYTYILIVLGACILVMFPVIERRVARPLIPNGLWRTPGFAPLMAAYFLGFGGYVGAWQFCALQFFLRIQQRSALTVAMYFLPNAVVGVGAAYIVSQLLHRIPGHYIYAVSMVCFALGPVFFLPQKANTTYWALSMPGIALSTFGPDLSFAAASIFITSKVPRSYQGSAGSLLVTIQNLSTAIMTAVANEIASRAGIGADGEISLKGLRAAWWFALATGLVGTVITSIAVKIPKEEESDHVV